jgi:ATP-binding cassette subfamily C protein CydC
MRSLFRLLRLWRPAAPTLFAAVLVAALATAASVALMAVAGSFVTAMALAGVAGVAFDYFTPSAVIRAAAIVRTGGRWVERVVGHAATFRLSADFRTELFAALERVAPGGLGDLASGDLLARLKSDVDRIELVFLRLVAPTAVALLVGGAGVCIAARLLPEAGLVLAVALLGAGWLLPVALARLGRSTGERVAERTADLRRRLVDHCRGLTPLLLTGAATARTAALERSFADLVAAEARLGRFGALGEAATGLAGDLAVVAVLALGAGAVGLGRLSGPDLGLLVLMILAVIEAIAPLPAAFAGFAAMRASIDRVVDLFDREPSVVEPERPRSPGASVDLVFDRVHFTRPGGRRPLLDGVDLCLPEGSRTAILGESGVGKSTLLDLVVRSLDPVDGEIRLGGVSLRDLAFAELRARIALVPQQPHVFAASLADNLRFARPQASDADLVAVLATVGLADWYERLPAGLATFLGADGARVSGGEIRRLAVARGLLRDARVLLLDEPTEGLDRDRAITLIETLEAATAGRTLVVVTHDATIAARMDRVLVLAGGRLGPADAGAS